MDRTSLTAVWPTIPDIADPDGPPILMNSLARKLVVSSTPITFYSPSKSITYSFAEIGLQALRTLAWMRDDLSLPSRSCIGIQAGNSHEWVVLDLACLLGGFTVFPFDLHHQIDPKNVCRTYNLAAFFTDRTASSENLWFRISDLHSHYSARDDGDLTADLRPVTWSRDDLISAKFTSGTTSKPKGVAAKAINVENSIRNTQRLMQHSADDLLLIFLPLSLLQQRMWIYSAILFDTPVVVTTPLFSMSALNDQRPTVVMGVPDFYETLRRAFQVKIDQDPTLRGRCACLPVTTASSVENHPQSPFGEFLGGRIRYLWTGSAPASEATLKFYEDHRVPLLQGYGMNEACIVAKNGPNDNRRGSSGRVMPNYKVTFDEDRQIIIHPRCEVNTSYLDGTCGDPPTFGPRGEIYTGDIGYLDDEGYLYVVGRIKEMIPLSNGRNVDPRPVEARLMGHHGITGAMIVGAGRPFCVALVTTDPSESISIDLTALRNIINAELPSYERVGKLVRLDEQFSVENGQLTSQYKLKRRVIEQRYEELIAATYGDLA